MKRRIGVVGFRGYSGSELVRLLKKHPGVEVILVEHRLDSTTHPSDLEIGDLKTLPAEPSQLAREGVELVFLATPHEASMELAPGLLEAGLRVIDLSGAFRLDPPVFERWYKMKHLAPGLQRQAVYGLPEFCRTQIAGARFVANPGCYPTAASLAIKPLVEAGVIDRTAGIICDAKSGVSGAGRKPSLRTAFCEVNENFSAYAVFEHRHVPEILMNCRLEEQELSFIAQLLPVNRGILETIYLRLKPGVDGEQLRAIYQSRYGDEPFIRIYPIGQYPDLRAVQFTNFCDIGIASQPDAGRALIIAAIDNLVKGAAGQAIQNMNLMLGFSETEALL